ncbi:MAG TPA: tRNA 2-thiouridine(34) synthase MnmA [Gemmatales bacterium]|nr:tRNA 2-thiouridine(34) synthase MnmA [Gemmatales bacterium]
MARIVVAMSGGVDSAVAAWRLRSAGHEVIGLFMRTGVTAPEPQAPAASKQGCCSAQDSRDARRVADVLDIPFYALDFAAEFERIIDHFAAEHLRGRTPNACVLCNAWLKFGKLWTCARALGADGIATGHYAQVRSGPGGPELHRAVDSAKDQSYFLFGIQQEMLARLHLPLGSLTKPEVRQLAAAAGLPVAHKPDSVSLCFLPDGDVAGLVERRRPGAATPGPILDRAGVQVGTHSGLPGVTVGQRKGLGVAGPARRFVLELLPQQNAIVLGTRAEALVPDLIAEGCHWLTNELPAEVLTKFSYREAAVPGRLGFRDAGTVRVRFESPQFGVAPGQAVVFYAGSRVLGGGWIGKEQPARLGARVGADVASG